MPSPANSVYRIQFDSYTILTQTYLKRHEHFIQFVWWGILVRWKRKCGYPIIC